MYLMIYISVYYCVNYCIEYSAGIISILVAHYLVTFSEDDEALTDAAATPPRLSTEANDPVRSAPLPPPLVRTEPCAWRSCSMKAA